MSTGKNTEIDSCASRQSAQGVVKEMIQRKQEQLDAIVTISDQVNWDNLTQEEESNLYHFFTRKFYP